MRKPWLPSTERTVAYMRALRDRGIDVPEPQGQDHAGRLVLEYVPGELAMDREPLDAEPLRRIGALVKAIHEASWDENLPVVGDWEPDARVRTVSFGHLFHTEEADAAAGRLAAFLDGYAPLGQTADYVAQHEHIWRRATGH